MLHLCRYERHKTTLQSAHWLILILTGMCEVAGQLQFHCLSRLNPFIPCVCAFTYLSSSIKITADTTSSSHTCCSLFSACSCKSCTWACQYTKIHRAFQDIHGSRKPGCNKRDRYSNLHFTWNNAVFRGHTHASSSAKLQHTQNVVQTHAYNSLLLRFAKESSVACNISSIFCIGLGTVGKILKQFKVTGDIGPSSESQCQERRHVHFLDDTHELFIIGLVLEQPTSQVKEICSKIENATFVKVSPATVCRLLHWFGMML